MQGHRVVACVLGDIDLVRALALAGIRSAVVAEPGDPARYSRWTVATVDAVDHWTRADELVERLLGFARTQQEAPVLYPQTDGDLLAVSRRRARLDGPFRLMLPDAELVEDLLDKGRFQALAERVDLPVPAAHSVEPAVEDPPVNLSFPLIVKPLVRRGLSAIGAAGKAARVEDERELRSIWSALADARAEALLQAAIAGPETCVESYHAYIDELGETVAEFTGRKVRTSPPRYGFTTAAQTTDAADVRAAGRDVLERLAIRGVAKVDFKRDEGGRLWLLEVNPRFNLWHHLGALAGVNIPVLVHPNLTGMPRPARGSARAGVMWCHPQADNWARTEAGLALTEWLPSVARAQAKSSFAWSDPMPFVRGVVMPVARGRLARAARRLTSTSR